jgi:hypothetical protein
VINERHSQQPQRGVPDEQPNWKRQFVDRGERRGELQDGLT